MVSQLCEAVCATFRSLVSFPLLIAGTKSSFTTETLHPWFVQFYLKVAFWKPSHAELLRTRELACSPRWQDHAIAHWTGDNLQSQVAKNFFFPYSFVTLVFYGFYGQWHREDQWNPFPACVSVKSKTAVKTADGQKLILTALKRSSRIFNRF